MKFTDLNKAGGIGANSSLVEIGSFTFVIDAGLHPKEVGNAAMPVFEQLEGRKLDFVILTHCHLDHLGALPVLQRRYPGIPVFMSVPSAMLAPRMLRNSVNVMKRQREELTIPEYPLFTYAEVEQVQRNFRPLRFEHPEVFSKGSESLTLTLYPSGHVAGAASILIEHPDITVYATGDILFDDLLTLPGARIPDMKVDVLIMETTRGLTERCSGKPRESEWNRLFETISHTVERGGSCLLPVFALGRMQEVFAMLHRARKQGDIPHCPVYATGLGMDITTYFDQISRETGLVSFRKRILKELGVRPPQLPRNPGFERLPPGIYVLSSGMMVEHTPSYVAAASLLHEDRNSVCFLGYCDPDTPGGVLKASARGDSFAFPAYELDLILKAEVDSFDLSGHADREELLDLIGEFEPRHVVLTHGDPKARDWFTEQIRLEGLAEHVTDPQPCIASELD